MTEFDGLVWFCGKAIVIAGSLLFVFELAVDWIKGVWF